MIVTVVGWKFESLIEANDTISRINKFYGIPEKPSNITQNYAMYVPMNMFGTTFYYILQSDDIQLVLGEPWEFIVDIA